MISILKITKGNYSAKRYDLMEIVSFCRIIPLCNFPSTFFSVLCHFVTLYMVDNLCTSSGHALYLCQVS